MSFESAYSWATSPSCHVAYQPGVLEELPHMLSLLIEFLVLSQTKKLSLVKSLPLTVGSQPLLVNHGRPMIT